MPATDRPVLVAFDGSAEARAAVAAAVDLFPGRRLVVASVWEPGLLLVSQTAPDAFGVTPPPPSAEQIATIDRVESQHALSVAEAGAHLARDRGADAEPHALEDGLSVADTLLAAAEHYAAAAVVVGSRGRGGVKSRLFGSTSRALLHAAHVPVVVVRDGPATKNDETT